MNVLHYRKRLLTSLQPPSVREVMLRHFCAPDDIAAWLRLRERAFTAERPPIRNWTPGDFQREMVAKWWWRHDRTWLAVDSHDAAKRLVGSITMALRGPSDSAVPIVHWLMVDPDFRGKGVGLSLLTRLEREAWQLGYRELHVETHIGWQSATELYKRAGYRPMTVRRQTR